MKQETKDVATKTQAPPPAVYDSRYLDTEVDERDITIPRLDMLQASSPAVQSGTVRAGAIVDSISNEPLATPVSVIIFYAKKEWHRWTEGQSKPEKFPYTPENSGLPYYDTVDGQKVNNKLTYVYAALLIHPDGTLSDLPYLITMNGKSESTFKQINMRFLELSKKGKPKFTIVTQLSAVAAKTQTGAVQKWDVKFGRETTPEEQQEAMRWFDTMAGGDYRTAGDESHDDLPPVGAPRSLRSDVPF